MPNCCSVVRKRLSLESWRAPQAGGSWWVEREAVEEVAGPLLNPLGVDGAPLMAVGEWLLPFITVRREGTRGQSGWLNGRDKAGVGGDRSILPGTTGLAPSGRLWDAAASLGPHPGLIPSTVGGRPRLWGGVGCSARPPSAARARSCSSTFKAAKRRGSILPLWELLSTPQGEATSHFPRSPAWLAARQRLWPRCPGRETGNCPEHPVARGPGVGGTSGGATRRRGGSLAPAPALCADSASAGTFPKPTRARARIALARITPARIAPAPNRARLRGTGACTAPLPAARRAPGSALTLRCPRRPACMGGLPLALRPGGIGRPLKRCRK